MATMAAAAALFGQWVCRIVCVLFIFECLCVRVRFWCFIVVTGFKFCYIYVLPRCVKNSYEKILVFHTQIAQILFLFTRPLCVFTSVVCFERSRAERFFFEREPLSAKTTQRRLMWLFSCEEVLGLDEKFAHALKYWMEMSQKEVRKKLKINIQTEWSCDCDCGRECHTSLRKHAHADTAFVCVLVSHIDLTIW